MYSLRKQEKTENIMLEPSLKETFNEKPKGKWNKERGVVKFICILVNKAFQKI